MASRWIDLKAIAKGVAAAVREILMRLRAAPGNSAANASTTMPPRDGPTMVRARSMPKDLRVSKPPRAMSSTASSGKVMR